MSTIKMIIAAIGSAIGLAIVIFIVVFLWRIKNDLADKRTAKDIADSVRVSGLLDQLEGRIAQLDARAAQSNTVLLTSRADNIKNPVVTGGGKKADSIANAAVNVCYDRGVAAVSDCRKARIAADSLPILKDSLSKIEKRLASRAHPRWTANGFVGYAWPMAKPMLGAETQFRLFNSLSATVGGDVLVAGPPKTRADSSMSKWRVKAGLTIPFR